MRLKNTYLILIPFTLLFSCDQDHGVMRGTPVEIYESTIPATGTVNQNIQLQLKAQATNGCYSNLAVELKKIDDRHFLIQAKANFKSNGMCPDVMVYEDTVINFKPAATGEYFFQINKEPFDIKNEKLVVN